MKRPRVAMMQPTFLPWTGYLALVAAADVFVFLDDFQFCRRSFHHRNRILLPDGTVRWVTLPVAHGGRVTLAEARPVLDGATRRRLLETLHHAWARCAHRDEALALVESWLRRDWPSLAEMNAALVEELAGRLGFTPRFVRSSALGSRGRRSERIADLLHRAGAGSYLAARGSLGYMVEDGVFPLEGIETYFQRYEPAPYPQLPGREFVPYLSVLDPLARHGAAATREIVLAGARPFEPWDEAVREVHR